MIDPGLADWRLLLDELHAIFRAVDYRTAASFVVDVAEVADGNVDVDVRKDGTVRVRVPHTDVETATAVGDLAARAGLTPEPLVASLHEIAIDAMDIPALRPFWREVMGYVEVGDNDLVHPDRLGPPIWFQQMDEPRTERNRFHIDVSVPHDVAEARVAPAISAGGTLLSDRAAKAFWVLADPEGNEACICTWQDRER